jgi:hypothetical protein
MDFHSAPIISFKGKIRRSEHGDFSTTCSL